MKIVSLSPAVTETLSLLGLEDETIGITPWCKMYLRNSNKDIVGSYLAINFDKLKRLSPDIVFIQSRVHDKFHRVLIDMGFNTYLIPLPTNIYAVISHIVLDVGAIVGRYVESRELGDRMAEEIGRIRRSADRDKPVRVYIEYLWPDKTYSTSGSLTFIDDAIRIAGGLNIYSDTPKEFFFPRDEDTVARDPQIILVNIEPPFENLTLNEYKTIRNGLASLDAYRENRIYLVRESRNVNLAHFGPSIVSTIKYIADILRSL